MELPLFPLQTVLYPGLPIPLHVFEDRYRQMFKRILDGQRRFGVVAIVRGREVGAGATYHPVGCVAEVAEVNRFADGRLDVVVVDDRPLLGIIRSMPALFRGQLASVPGVSMETAVTAEVVASGAIRYHVDGEPCEADGRLAAAVRAGALTVCA